MKIVRVAGINLVLFVVLLFTFEFGFRLLTAWNVTIPKPKEISQPPKKMSDAEAISEFGKNVFTVPPQYVVPYKPVAYTGAFSKEFDPPHFFEDLNEPATKSRTYQVRGFRTQETKKVQLYSVNYTIDQHNRRTVLNQDNKISKRAILAIGDSFTFGEGVEDGTDYSSILASKLDNETKVYNFGIMGASLVTTLRKIRTAKFDWLGGIKEPEGDIVYLIFDQHLDRYYCTLSCYRKEKEYILQNTQFILQPDGTILEGKKFSENYSPERLLWKLLSYSKLLEHLNFEWPVYYSDKQLEEYVNLLTEIKKEFEKRMKINRVLVYSLYSYRNEENIARVFRHKGIEYRRLDEIPYREHIQHHRIPGDGHFTSEFYWVLSEVIKADLARTARY